MNSAISGFIGFLLITAACISTSYAQELRLTDADRKEIRSRAELRMQELEDLLQLISDPTRNRSAINRYILSSYSANDSLFNQIFYSDEVFIEDDITPLDLTKEQVEVSALPVATYLNNFKLEYEKQSEKTVFFNNIQYSDVKKEGFFYLIASFESQFTGKHIIFKNHQYKPVKRKATIRADFDFDKDKWLVRIAGINYDRESISFSIKNKPVVATSAIQEPDHPSTQGKDESVLNPVTDVPVLITNTNQEQGESEVTLSFTGGLAEEIKRGVLLPLEWNNAVTDASLSLLKNGVQESVLQKGLSGQHWDWKVKQKPGKGYSLVLYDSKTERQAISGKFQIKPKFPLAVKIGIPVALAGYLIYASQNGIFPFSPDPPPTLPTTPIDYTIDIEPLVPGN